MAINNRYMKGDSLLQKIFKKKESTERSLQEIGRRIRTNFQQGQKDFRNRTNNSTYYGTINPIKDIFKK